MLVATGDIAARTTGEAMVAGNLVVREEVVVSSAAPGALASESQLQGKVLTVPVAKGQQILESQLGVPEEQSLSYRVKTGMRAISIAVDRMNAVGGAIKEGDRVDVIVTFDADQFAQVAAARTLEPTTTSTQPTTETTASTGVAPVTAMNLGMVLSPAELERVKQLTGLDLSLTVSNVSVTLLQQVDVLAIDNLLPVATTSNSGGAVLSSKTQSTAGDVPDSPVITLMLTPADAEKIVYAQTYGKITFTLVPAQDTTKVDTNGRAFPNLFR